MKRVIARLCEDRGVEAYGKLQVLLNGANVYPRLLHLFYQADDRYNSGIFHFKTERDHPEAPDSLTPSLQIDDKVLKDILNNRTILTARMNFRYCRRIF